MCNIKNINTKKTILLISSNSSGRGGGERYLTYLAKGLIEIGYCVDVLLSNREYMDGWDKELNAIGATIHRKDLKGLSDRPFRFIQAILDRKQIRNITNMCREISPNAILVNRQYDEDGMDYVMGAIKAKVAPVSSIIHMPMTQDKNRKFLGRLRGLLVRLWHVTNKHRLIFSSEGGRHEFDSYYQIKYDEVIVQSGADFTNRASRHDEVGASFNWLRESKKTRLPIIGFVGQFVQQKNIDSIIDAWIMCGFTYRLLLVGDGPQRQDIEARLLSLAPQDLWHITGWGSEYSEYMRHIDLYVMPSLYEGLPLALIEIVGMGIPSIISNFNGAKEIASFADWVEILQVNHSSQLAEAIKNKLTNLEGLKAVSSFRCREFMDQFSTNRMARDMAKAMGLE